jgi:hypothetical protein
MTFNRLDLYSRNGSGNFTLVDDTGVSPAMGGSAHAASRIHLLFLPYLTGSGAKFEDNSGYLAAFYNDDYLNNGKDPEPRWMRAYLPGYIAPGGAQFLGRAARRSQYQVLNQLAGTAIAAAQHGPHAGVLYIRENDVASLQYVPHANGIPDAAYPAHQDTDDAAVIHAQMCGMLIRGCAARCSNAFAANPYGIACAAGPAFESGPCTE